MKPKIIITLILVLCLPLVLATVIFMARFLQLPQGAVEISGDVIDNDFNNYLSGGNLVRIKNKLYFNYNKSNLSYGLIEITDEGSNRIYWEGVRWFGYYYLTHPIRKDGDHLLMSIENSVKRYSAEEEKFVEDSLLSAAMDISMDFHRNNGSIVYMSWESIHKGKVWMFDGVTPKILVDKNVSSFYMQGDEVYYLVIDTNSDDHTREIWKYNVHDQSDTLICKLNDFDSLYSFLIVGNYLVFGSSQTSQPSWAIYKIDLKKDDKTVETICVGDNSVSTSIHDIRSYNAYNNSIYVASHNGLVSYDVITNAPRQLYDKYVEECYVVDNKWVYFVDKNAALWRVTQDGAALEKVYG